MRAILVGWGLVAAGIACGPAPAAKKAERPTLTIESSRSELPERSRRSHSPPVKPCGVTSDDYLATGQRWPLMREDGARWAWLQPRRGGRATAFFGDEDEQLLRYVFAGDGLELEGQVAREAVRVYAGEPVWFEDVILARREHVFDPGKADADRVELELELGSWFVPKRLTRSVDCDWLQLVPGSFDTPNESWRPRSVLGDEPLPLFARAEGGRATVTVKLNAGEQISAGRVAGDRQRIFIPYPELYVFAWVPTARLATPAGLHGHGGYHPASSRVAYGRRQYGSSARVDYRCRDRLPLHVVIEDRYERVGTVLPGRELWVNLHEKAQGAFLRIRIDDGPVVLDKAARFAVRRRELEACDRVRP